MDTHEQTLRTLTIVPSLVVVSIIAGGSEMYVCVCECDEAKSEEQKWRD